MSTLLRPALSADTSDIVALSTQVSGVSFSNAQAERACSANEDTLKSLVVVVDDSVVGFIAYAVVIDEASILAIAVANTFQGSGLGGRLLQGAFSEMRSAGLKRCLLEVRSSNSIARQLYRTRGFVEDGLRKNYYGSALDSVPDSVSDSGSQREDAVLMSLDLQAIG
ncbi:MAG: ribosomal protein S18-alanine N-acetyltransferase [Halioglobus sp.]